MACPALRFRTAPCAALFIALPLLVSSTATGGTHASGCAAGDASAMRSRASDRQSRMGTVLANAGDVSGCAVRLRGGGNQAAADAEPQPAEPATAGPTVDTTLVFKAQSCTTEEINIDADAHASQWSVHLVGSWSNWLERHPARWNPDLAVFEAQVSLPAGTHEFKFVVNDHWVTTADYAIIENTLGANNILEITEEAAAASAAAGPKGAAQPARRGSTPPPIEAVSYAAAAAARAASAAAQKATQAAASIAAASTSRAAAFHEKQQEQRRQQQAAYQKQQQQKQQQKKQQLEQLQQQQEQQQQQQQQQKQAQQPPPQKEGEGGPKWKKKWQQKAEAYATAAAAATAHQNEKKELKAHISQLRQEVVQLKHALSDQGHPSAQELEELRSQLKASEAARKEAEDNFSSALDKIQEMADALAASKTGLETSKAEIARLTAQVEDLAAKAATSRRLDTLEGTPPPPGQDQWDAGGDGGGGGSVGRVPRQRSFIEMRLEHGVRTLANAPRSFRARVTPLFQKGAKAVPWLQENAGKLGMFVMFRLFLPLLAGLAATAGGPVKAPRVKRGHLEEMVAKEKLKEKAKEMAKKEKDLARAMRSKPASNEWLG